MLIPSSGLQDNMRSCSHFMRLKKARVQAFSSFSWNSGVRLALVITLITGALLVNFFTLTARVQAASLPTTVQTSSSATHSSAIRKPNASPHAINPAPRYALLKSQKVNVHVATTNAVPKTLSASNPLNGLGDLPFYTYVDKKLSDHMDMKVNVANGNLLLHTTELSISGTGLDFNWGGYYNSEANGWLLDHGINWNFSAGRGATLDLSNLSSGVALYAPSGYAVFFASNGSGGFKDAAAIDASMSYDSGGQTYAVTFHHTGEQWVFNTYGTLVFDYDKNGNLINPYWNDHGDLLQIVDTQNRTITFNHTPDYQISTVTDPINRTVSYGYNLNNDFLLSITDLNQKQTTFNYNSNAYLTTVTDPQGNTTMIAYSASGQVTSITDAKNGMTKFTYNNGSTVVTDPLGHTTTYTYNSNLEVLKTTDALGHYGTGTYQNGGYNVTQYSDALTNTSSFQYDTNNNMTSSKDGNGAVTNYT